MKRKRILDEKREEEEWDSTNSRCNSALLVEANVSSKHVVLVATAFSPCTTKTIAPCMTFELINLGVLISTHFPFPGNPHKRGGMG